jgi:Domain of unknown function (DUF4145)
MIVECSYCEAKVDARVIANHTDPPDDVMGTQFRVSLLTCPNCGNALLAGENEDPFTDSDILEWTIPNRIWPAPDRHFSWHIPLIVRSSLEEANKCFKATAYSACAVMCGRSLEGICRHYKTRSGYLGGGLKELLEKEIIDKRLFAWSEALQKSRNLGAHASEEVVSKEDAGDLLDFANVIAEYVFVLTEKFRAYLERQQKAKNDGKKPDD